MWKVYTGAPCLHVYAWYQRLWLRQPCIAYAYLKRGYYQAAHGVWYPENNLFELERSND